MSSTPSAPAHPVPIPKVVPQPNPDANLIPTTFVCGARTHYYQIPPNPKGTLVFLHGCDRTAQGFWPRSLKHPECYGFPEDVSHTKQALAKGYAILVPTPRDLAVLGWSFSAGDPEPLISIISTFLEQHNLASKPVILGGASAGGGLEVGLVSYLKDKHRPMPWKWAGIISEVSTHGVIPPKDSSFPPIVYIVMEKDIESQTQARQHLATLQAAHVRCAMHVSPVRVIGPSYFSDRVPDVDLQISQQIVQALHALNALDAQSKLKLDPKDQTFRNNLSKKVPAVGNLAIKTSPIMQALLLAYGEHEHISDWTMAALTFIESGGNFTDLATRLEVAKPTSFHVKL